MILVWSSYRRYREYRPTIWVSRPRCFAIAIVVIFNLPLTVMALTTIVRLIDQWIVLYNFFSSGWLPHVPYHADNMYGLRWAYDVIIQQVTLVVLLSFAPTIMLLREGEQRYAWIYKGLFLFGIGVVIVLSLTMVRRFDYILDAIHSHFVNLYLGALDDSVPFSAQVSDIQALQQMLLTQRLSDLIQLPSQTPLPPWLGGLLGFRLIVLLGYNLLKRRFAWPPLPELFSDFVKSVS